MFKLENILFHIPACKLVTARAACHVVAEHGPAGDDAFGALRVAVIAGEGSDIFACCTCAAAQRKLLDGSRHASLEREVADFVDGVIVVVGRSGTVPANGGMSVALNSVSSMSP